MGNVAPGRAGDTLEAPSYESSGSGSLYGSSNDTITGLEPSPSKRPPLTLASLNIPPHLIIDYTAVLIEKELGRGSFGVVYAAKVAEKRVAMKTIQQNTLLPETASSSAIEDFVTEVTVMSHLQHRNVIQLIGACLPPHPLCIVVELLEKGDLDAILEDKSEVVDRARLLRFALDIAQGMDCLHAAKIIHSDLKPSNVLVSADDVCKVGDFGLSKIMNIDATSVTNKTGGTPAFTAPEVFRGERISPRADVYAFGIAMWQLWTRQRPFAGMQVHPLIYSVVSRNKRPEIPDDCDYEYALLMRECWESDQRRRPTFNEVMRRLRQAQESPCGVTWLEGLERQRLQNVNDGVAASAGEDVRCWTVEEVCLWLCEIGFDDLQGIFADNDIDGTILLTLDDDDLREDMSITSLGRRRKFLEKQQELRQANMRGSAVSPRPQSICDIEALEAMQAIEGHGEGSVSESSSTSSINSVHSSSSHVRLRRLSPIILPLTSPRPVSLDLTALASTNTGVLDLDTLATMERATMSGPIINIHVSGPLTPEEQVSPSPSPVCDQTDLPDSTSDIHSTLTEAIDADLGTVQPSGRRTSTVLRHASKNTREKMMSTENLSTSLSKLSSDGTSASNESLSPSHAHSPNNSNGQIASNAAATAAATTTTTITITATSATTAGSSTASRSPSITRSGRVSPSAITLRDKFRRRSRTTEDEAFSESLGDIPSSSVLAGIERRSMSESAPSPPALIRPSAQGNARSRSTNSPAKLGEPRRIRMIPQKSFETLRKGVSRIGAVFGRRRRWESRPKMTKDQHVVEVLGILMDCNRRAASVAHEESKFAVYRRACEDVLWRLDLALKDGESAELSDNLRNFNETFRTKLVIVQNDLATCSNARDRSHALCNLFKFMLENNGIGDERQVEEAIEFDTEEDDTDFVLLN